MNTSSNILKLFGMSNQMLLHDLDKVESTHELILAHNQNSSKDKDDTYYPQFNATARSKAKEMAQHYETFYCLEFSIRALICEMLRNKAGISWWDNEQIIPKIVQDEVKQRIKNELNAGVSIRSDEPLDYANFEELGEIIKNNGDVFGSIFTSQKGIERVLASLSTLRGPITHCSELAEDEVLRLTLNVHDWFRLIA